MRKRTLWKGFSLIEIVIVTGIIVILSTVIIYSLNPVEGQKKTRDLKRVRETTSLSTLLEQMTMDKMPLTGCLISPEGCQSCDIAGLQVGNGSCSNNWLQENVCDYAQSIPADPLNCKDTKFWGNSLTNPLYVITQAMYTARVLNRKYYKVEAMQESSANIQAIINDNGINPYIFETGNNLTLETNLDNNLSSGTGVPINTPIPPTPIPTMPPNCANLYNLIITKQMVSCGNPNYDKRADLDKNQGINSLDVSYGISRTNNYTNDAACLNFLNDPKDPCAKWVFVTSQEYYGDFGGQTGLAGADQICQTLANNAGIGNTLSRTYKAWLSDSTTSAASRLTHATMNYKLVDATLIANDWNDLTDGTIANPINKSENNETFPEWTMVWTGTNINGTGTSLHCDNWTRGYVVGYTAYSGILVNSSDWTYGFGNYFNCASYGHLYCFEQ